MNNRIDRSIRLRAQEIVLNSSEPLTTVAAITQALRERFGDDIDALYEAAAASAASSLRGLKRSTWILPEEDGPEDGPEDGQIALFDIPQVIVVSTEEGDLVVPKPQAATGHVRQWVREGTQHHSVQLSRFKRAGREMEAADDQDDSIPWDETRVALVERKRKELEAGQ